MEINPKIFKAYDIRGIYPDDLNEEVVYQIGRAFVIFLGGARKIVVGQDMRLSSPSLAEFLIRGINDQGADVVDIGLVSTPTFYFATAYRGYDGGVVVTASHNPKEYNGLKLVRKEAVTIGASTGMDRVKELVAKGEFPSVEKRGKIEKQEGVLQKKIQEHLKMVDSSAIRPLKVVVDAANSMGALDIEELFKHLPCELIKINFELDGAFPAHEADPMKEENLKQLQEAVMQNKADLGIATDGDCDRIFFVDDRGETINQAIIRGVLAQIFLRQYPGARICYDIRPGRITRDLIEEARGVPVVTKVGHSLIKAQAREEGAVFAGESSGHFFVKLDYGFFETPMLIIAKLLEELSKQKQSISEWLGQYKDRYYHSGEINSEVEDKEGKIKELTKIYADAEMNFLDGITVTYKDWWFNVRPSNTEPLLRLNLEAKTRELMEEKRDEVLNVIRA